MENEYAVTYQTKVSICHYFCMENGDMSQRKVSVTGFSNQVSLAASSFVTSA